VPRRPTLEFAEKLQVREPGAIYLARQTSEKSAVSAISQDYLKRHIIATNHIVASPGGMIVPYEGGYGLLALMERDWVGNQTLVADVLDAMVGLQNADGSWDQQYYPQKGNDPYVDPAGHRRQVDSGAAMMAYAMADYDARNASVTYKTYWQKAFDFLYSLRWEIAVGYELIKNQVINGVAEDVAFTADMAEVILAAVRGFDAYGNTVTLTDGVTVVRDWIAKVVAGIDSYMWEPANYYYRTEYPSGAQSECKKDPDGNPIYITFKQCVTFVQALIAWAYKNWDANYGSDHSTQTKMALDQVIALNQGRWGGFIEHMQYTAYDYPAEYPHYAALMRIAMSKVDATRYARWISKTQSFLRQCALADGQVMDQVFPDGRAVPSPWARGPLMVTAATAILAGA
jgi:hypothetical protein